MLCENDPYIQSKCIIFRSYLLYANSQLLGVPLTKFLRRKNIHYIIHHEKLFLAIDFVGKWSLYPVEMYNFSKLSTLCQLSALRGSTHEISSSKKNIHYIINHDKLFFGNKFCWKMIPISSRNVKFFEVIYFMPNLSS